ncbi:MAG: cytidylate kinase family protein [Bacilli bacterium]|nr:cytidylate kinase family protein [Bacilli bacterium]MBO6194856.1 cytidylate kinase family protein [Bacilli bacterium]
MKKKNIISISGELASGKSTIINHLLEDLGYTVYRNGEYFRKLAKEMNMSVTDFNVYVEDHPEIDRQIENSAAEYAKENDEFIIDARLGWYAVPESFKVYVTVDIDEAAKRAFNDPNRKETESFNTIEEQKADIQKRYKLENDRYFNLYNVHKDDLSNYDFVIDTTNLTPKEAANKIKEEYHKWLKK